jgi:Flp pilus assembly pilin Flp
LFPALIGVAALFVKLWKDEAGFIHASNYILITTIIGIGAVAGLTSLRDSVTQQFGDLALGLENLDQSYTINCTIGTVVKQFGFMDNDAGDDVANQAPAGIQLNQPATPE